MGCGPCYQGADMLATDGGSEAWENWWASDSQDFKDTVYHHLPFGGGEA